MACAAANRDSTRSRLIFAGLTAYDTQQITLMYYEADGEEATMGTVKLYLGFLNMFIFLTHILGTTRKWKRVAASMLLSMDWPFCDHCRRLGEAIWGIRDNSICNVTWAFADITRGGST